MSDQWRYWSAALQGDFIEELIAKGQPQSGFYRDRSKRAVAIWRDESGALQCLVTSGYQPRHDDEIDEIFGWVCRQPITRELFVTIQQGGAWPEDVALPERGVGDNSAALDPHEAIKADINNLVDSARAWLEEIGGKVSTPEQADKIANYAEAFTKLEKQADAARIAEKKPHDEAAKEIQAKWKPVVELADEKKRWCKKAFEVYALEEKRRREEAARKAAAEEAARIEAQRRAAEEMRAQAEKQAAETGVPVDFTPPKIDEPPEPDPVKNVVAGTRARVALKTRTDYVITDLPALLAYLATLDPPPRDLIDVAQKLANRLGSTGTIPPGVESKITEYAA